MTISNKMSVESSRRVLHEYIDNDLTDSDLVEVYDQVNSFLRRNIRTALRNTRVIDIADTDNIINLEALDDVINLENLYLIHCSRVSGLPRAMRNPNIKEISTEGSRFVD